MGFHNTTNVTSYQVVDQPEQPMPLYSPNSMPSYPTTPQPFITSDSRQSTIYSPVNEKLYEGNYNYISTPDLSGSTPGGGTTPPIDATARAMVGGNKAGRLLYTIIIHLFPITFTVCLLFLNHTHQFWYPTEGPENVKSLRPNVINNLLQIASKIHEIFILLSLATVVKNIFTRHLVKEGLPFGVLTAGYRVGDLLYVASGAFWSSFSRKHGVRVGLLSVMFFGVTFICAVVGPGSAILLVPQLGWVPLANPFDKIVSPAVLEPEDVLWPGRIDKELFEGAKLTHCQTEMGQFEDDCPAGAFADFWNWMGGWEVTGLSDSMFRYEASVNLNRKLLSNTPNMDSEDKSKKVGITTSTTISRSTFSAIGYLMDYIRTNNVGAVHGVPHYKIKTTGRGNKQPLVQTQCRLYEAAATIKHEDVLYDASEIDCFDNADCQALVDVLGETTILPNVYEGSQKLQFGNRWVPLANNETLSATILAYRDSSARGTLDNLEKMDDWFITCTVMAHWAPSTITLEPDANEVLSSDLNVKDSVKMKEVGDELRKAKARPISLELSWLDYLNPAVTSSLVNPLLLNEGVVNQNINENTTTVMNRSFQLLLTQLQQIVPGMNQSVFWPGSGENPNSDSARVLMQRFLGAYVAEALAHTSADPFPMILLSDNPTKSELEDLQSRKGISAGKTTIEWDVNDRNSPGLSKKGSMSEPYFSRAEWETNLIPNWVHLSFDAEQYGWMSGLPSKTIGFGYLSMYAYLVFLVAYAVGGLIRSATAVRAWHDMQDVIALAWSSIPPPSLRQVLSDPRREKELWDTQVAIRADVEGKVHLVLGSHGEQTGYFSRLKRKHLYT